MKTCSKCKTEYLATTEYFAPSTQTNSGLSPQCRMCRRQNSKLWYNKNKNTRDLEAKNFSLTKWRIKNQARVKADARLYDKRVKQAMPQDIVIKKQIRKFYFNRPIDLTVDHLIPLKNDLVCGLHVPWNLTYFTKTKNSLKSNKFESYCEVLNG